MSLLKIATFLLSILLAWYMVTSDYPKLLLDKLLPYKLVAVFVAGALYSSFLTGPLAVAALLILSSHLHPVLVALVGGLGAMVTDVLIVRTYRKLGGMLGTVYSRHAFKALGDYFREFHLDIVAVVAGMILIASPLPDELGLLFLGASKLSPLQLTASTFILNSIGILVIAVIAQTV